MLFHSLVVVVVFLLSSAALESRQTRADYTEIMTHLSGRVLGIKTRIHGTASNKTAFKVGREKLTYAPA